MSSPEPETFATLGLRPELLEVLTRLGYAEPTAVQLATIPPLLDGRDLIGQAATGTGKTAAFALPTFQRLSADGTGARAAGSGPGAIVLVPTRELAMQVSEAMQRYGRGLGATVVPIFGGQPMGRQLQALRRPVDVVVATPGRALDHLRRGSLQLADVAIAILDEADEMLDMGFAEDIEELLDATPDARQTMLFSATMPPRIDKIARTHLRDPVRIQVEAEPTPAGEEAQVSETAYIVRRAHKAAALGRVLDIEMPAAALVFCRTRRDVEELAETLNGRGHVAEALHGGMDQSQRDRVMNRVRTGAADLLVATDVAARGLDIDVLSHVVNFEVPSAPESYVHRIGRVGRAGRAGVAITLVDPSEHRRLKNIERVTRRRLDVAEVPSVADLRSRRMKATQAAVREAIEGGDIDQYRSIVNDLAEHYDAVEIALAAVKLAHHASGASLDDESEIPAAHLPAKGAPGKQAKWSGRESSSSGRGRDDRPRGHPKRGAKPRGRGGNRAMTRLYVSSGRNGGVRPQDLVGAITGETSLSGKDVGSIELTPNFSLVEVPTDSVDEVLGAMKRTTIRGKRTTVRRERFTSS